MSSCTFCGHHDAPDSIRVSIENEIEKLILHNNVTCFYVGSHGRFDSMALSVLRECKEKYTQIIYFVVLAYLPEKKDEYQLYQDGETLYPDGIENVPKRFAISYRNKWMVEHSDYIISYVQNNFGGAAKTLEYAKKEKLIQRKINSD